MEKNYFSHLMDKTYHLIKNTYVDWPFEMETEDQKKLVLKLIEYYSDREDFEKCIVLKQKLQRIDAEINEI
jgi:Txe/YoeB family toxin of Txe-Axe toxin-antitoxin module